jgi:hypothetical protein
LYRPESGRSTCSLGLNFRRLDVLEFTCFLIFKNTRNDETCRQLDALFYPIMSGSLSADRLTSWNVLNVRWNRNWESGSVKSGRNIEPANRNLPAVLEDDRNGSHHTTPTPTKLPFTPFGVPVCFSFCYQPQRVKRNNNLSQNSLFFSVQNLPNINSFHFKKITRFYEEVLEHSQKSDTSTLHNLHS